jgi:allophanate hydrolase
MTITLSNESSQSLSAPRTVDEAIGRVAEYMQRCDAYLDKAVWIYRFSKAEIEPQIQRLFQRHEAGEPQPLFGLTFAAKDNIDLAGAPTTAACPDFSYLPAKAATVVSRLCDAGAICLGTTNLDQFATGLVGTRSPYGAVKNPFRSEYISGGSSSGSAVAVAAGLVDFSLGTDTAGSGRVPAAFCNIVGLKPTRGFLSTAGLVPACRSLDCISIFTRTCEEAAKVFAVARGFDEEDIYSRRDSDLPAPMAPMEKFRFGIPKDDQLEFFGNHDADWLYRHAIHHAIGLGGEPVQIDYAPFRAAAALLYDGPWVAERLVASKDLLQKSPESILPVVRGILMNAARFTALDTFEAQYKLLELQRQAKRQWEKMDMLLLPTTGTIYTIAEVEADPIRLNTNLGYYTNFANLLDLCAVAVPNGFQPNGLPAGITFLAQAGNDDWLLALGHRYESAITRGLE